MFWSWHHDVASCVTTHVSTYAYTIGCLKVEHLPPMRPMTLIQFAKCPVSHIALAKAGQSLRWWPCNVWFIEPPGAQSPPPPPPAPATTATATATATTTTTTTTPRSLWYNEKGKRKKKQQVIRIQNQHSMKRWCFKPTCPVQKDKFRPTVLRPKHRPVSIQQWHQHPLPQPPASAKVERVPAVADFLFSLFSPLILLAIIMEMMKQWTCLLMRESEQ